MKIFLKHIIYNSEQIMKRDSHKEFVYSNICHQVSNYMTESVSLIIQTNHKEYICCRDKPIIKHSKFNYCEAQLN